MERCRKVVEHLDHVVGETATVSPLLGDSMDLEEHGRKREKKGRIRRGERERGVEEGG